MDKRIKEVIFTKDEIFKKIDVLATEINKHYESETQPVIGLGLLKGCINFLGHFITKLNFHITTDFIKTSVTEGATSKDNVEITWGLDEINFKNKKVLIIEDVVNSAITLTQVIKLLKELGAIEVKVVTLLDKVSGRKTEFTPDWCALTTDTHDWLVGWGLDFNEWGRRFEFIASIKDEYK